MSKQNELTDLTNELYSIANKKISRREALSAVSKIAIAATTASLAVGLTGYFLGSSFNKEATRTLTETKYETRTEKITETTTKTETKYITTTKTETPIINMEVKVGKSYNPIIKDYEVGIKVTSRNLGPFDPLDNLVAYLRNSSSERSLNRDAWKSNYDYRIRERSFEVNFTTNREIGEQRITLVVEKDGAMATKDLSVNIGLSEEEISSSNIPREDLKLLWRDILEDERVDVDREELFKKEFEIANSVGIKNVSELKSQYLKGFTKTLISRIENHERFLRGAGLILRSLDDRPWIYYGNFTRDQTRAEFPLGEEEAYLLTRFASEVDVDEEHLYAARATIDQLRAICLWLSSPRRNFSPFDIIEYDGERIQLWDLTKRLFEKQIKYEKMGMRASVRDIDLIRRWSTREEINNRHMYYALKQTQLPGPAFTTDIDKINFIRWYDENCGCIVTAAQPRIIENSNYIPIIGEILFTFKKYVDRFEYFNEFLNRIIRNPYVKLYSPSWNMMISPKEMIEANFKLIPWEGYFPNSSKEAYKDIFETLFLYGSLESKYPIIAYATSDILKHGPDEERVEGGILFSSYLGYPTYRIGISYPRNTDFWPYIHGEISFLLNKEDENLLYKRSNDILIVERKHTYSLPYLWTRKSAILKDQEEKGEIRYGTIYLPILNEEYYRAYSPVRLYEFKIDELIGI